MFENSLRDATLAGAMVLSALGMTPATAQEATPSAPSPEPQAVKILAENEMTDLSQASMPKLTISPLAGKHPAWNAPSVRYLSDRLHGPESTITMMGVAGMLAGFGGMLAGAGVVDALRPNHKLPNGEYDLDRIEKFDKKAHTAVIAAGLGGALLGAGYMLNNDLHASNIVVDTTIASVSTDKDQGTMHFKIPECSYPLEVPESGMFNMLKPGEPIRLTFVVDKNGESLTGWYVAPQSPAPTVGAR